MKGIILAGGYGTRLYPITKSISKQLLNIYDKPMIFYPLSTLMMSGITDILIITTKEDSLNYKKLLGNGSHLGINLSYLNQDKPNGIAEAFLIGENFIGKEDVCLILGDNMFYGHGFNKLFSNSISKVIKSKKALIFGYQVNNPNRYGVIEFDENKKVSQIIEKPSNSKSSYAVIGLYIFPNSVVNKAKIIKPSERGELEITSINNSFLKENKLLVELIDSGFTWFDAGTPDSLLEASNFIQAIEKRHAYKIACIEEIAYRKGYISKNDLISISKSYNNCEYGKYLINLI